MPARLLRPCGRSAPPGTCLNGRCAAMRHSYVAWHPAGDGRSGSSAPSRHPPPRSLRSASRPVGAHPAGPRAELSSQRAPATDVLMRGPHCAPQARGEPPCFARRGPSREGLETLPGFPSQSTASVSGRRRGGRGFRLLGRRGWEERPWAGLSSGGGARFGRRFRCAGCAATRSRASR